MATTNFAKSVGQRILWVRLGRVRDIDVVVDDYPAEKNGDYLCDLYLISHECSLCVAFGFTSHTQALEVGKEIIRHGIESVMAKENNGRD